MFFLSLSLSLVLCFFLSTYCSCYAYEGSLNLLCVTLGCFLSGAFTEITGKRRAMQVSKAEIYAVFILFKSIYHIAISTTSLNPIVFINVARSLSEFSLLGIHSITNYVKQIIEIPVLASWSLFYFSTNVYHLYVGLCLTGIGGGLMESSVSGKKKKSQLIFHAVKFRSYYTKLIEFPLFFCRY